jgi:hypothetical protein
MNADKERGRPRQEGAPRKLAAKLASEPKSTAPVLAGDVSGVAVLEAELPELLRSLGTRSPGATARATLSDAERLALALCDTFGPTWARRLAGELLAAADDIAPPRTPWPGCGRA